MAQNPPNPLPPLLLPPIPKIQERKIPKTQLLNRAFEKTEGFSHRIQL